MNKIYALRFIASLLWMGFLIAISFMEAPLKFQAPSVTLPIGLEIGRIIFGTLNKMEWVLLLVILLSFILSQSTRPQIILIVCLAAILLFQTFYLLPILDTRAESIISGTDPGPSKIHFSFVALEVVKLILLSVATYSFIFKQQLK